MARELGAADAVATSDLTVLEIHRALSRLVAQGRLAGADADDLRKTFLRASRHWSVAPISRRALAAARGPFPCEPVRSLDAIHLAIVSRLREDVPDLGVLSLDERIRENARLFGVTVLP